jgi:hypothetical protein
MPPAPNPLGRGLWRAYNRDARGAGAPLMPDTLTTNSPIIAAYCDATPGSA